MKRCLACRLSFAAEGWRCPACNFTPENKEGVLVFSPELERDGHGFEERFFSPLRQVEDGSFWFAARNELILLFLKRHFPSARRVLEIGCGTGKVLSALKEGLPDVDLAGSDVFTRGLSFAAERVPSAFLFQMDARQIPFTEDFDVIGAFDVLEHIPEDEKVLGEMFRAVRSGGGILLSVPQHEFLWGVVDEYSRHVRRYRREDLLGKVRAAGFTILGATSFVSLLLPALLLARRVRTPSLADFDPLAELRMGRFSNAMLSGMMGLERALIRSGVSFPAGGSLLVAARRC